MKQNNSIAYVFKAIASPTRIAIIRALMSGEKAVTEIADQIKMTHSAVSHQLAVLSSAGIVIGAQNPDNRRFSMYKMAKTPEVRRIQHLITHFVALYK